jgi:hypothetical protein
MTIAMLMRNTLLAARRQLAPRQLSSMPGHDLGASRSR